MIAVNLKYNRSTASWEAAVANIDHICGVAPNTWYFDNACQGVGHLLVSAPFGKTDSERYKYIVLLNTLLFHAGAIRRVSCIIDDAVLFTQVEA